MNTFEKLKTIVKMKNRVARYLGGFIAGPIQRSTMKSTLKSKINPAVNNTKNSLSIVLIFDFIHWMSFFEMAWIYKLQEGVRTSPNITMKI